MNKTILITGSSTGIGRTTAKWFHSKGWNVIATMRTPEKEEELSKMENVLVTRLDVLSLDSIDNAIKAGLERFGKIDVLLNNAGYGSYGPLEATPREKILRLFNTNVIGLLDVTKAVLPHFRQNREGVVINISSIGGKMTFPLGTLYHGTKFAVEGLSEALSYELAEIGVKMKIVEPGIINTDFGGRSFDFNNDENMTEYQGIVGKLMTTLGGKMQGSEPEVVAKVIYTAATDGTDQLRYEAGDDAVEIITNRKKLDDATFISGIKAQMGLE
jgi:NADP-dependent 3-hydroxy acid dehydrogenase YdfG